MTEENIHVPIVTFSTVDSIKLLQELKPGFTQSINWKKYRFENDKSR